MRFHKVLLALIVPLTVQSAVGIATASWAMPLLWVSFVASLFAGYLLLLKETGQKHALAIAVAYFPLMTVALLYLSLGIVGKITGRWL